MKDNIEELAGMSIEEIERCFEPIGDNTLVKGRDTEYFTSDGEKIIFDSVFDLHILTSDGEIIIKVEIEGQRNPRPGYPFEKRAQYYLASMVSAQKGTEFTGKNYGDVRKAYSIWLILEPISRDKNSRDVYQFDVKHSYGDKDHVPAHLDLFNLTFMNIGEYNDGLPDSMAMASALFSEMGRKERRELVKKRSNIDLDDNDLERLDEMSTLHEDAYEHGYADGNDNGINQERKNSIYAMADIVMAFRNGDDSVEQSMSKVSIPANYRSDVEAEVRRRLS